MCAGLLRKIGETMSEVDFILIILVIGFFYLVLRGQEKKTVSPKIVVEELSNIPFRGCAGQKIAQPTLLLPARTKTLVIKKELQ